LSHFSRPRKNKVPSISRVFVLIFVYRFLSTILDFLRLFCFSLFVPIYELVCMSKRRNRYPSLVCLLGPMYVEIFCISLLNGTVL
jgi:hypothetical protein